MSGDTLKRVQAVKKWLEKAESSYSKHKDITGEINLIMAQAEMQRLKETRRPSAFYRWSLRGCAMIVAVGLFFGGSYVYHSATEENTSQPAPIEMVQKEATPVSTVTLVTEVSEKSERKAADRGQETAVVSVPAETAVPVAGEAVIPAIPVSAPAVAAAEAPHQEAKAASAARPAPALSEKEIQSVVGEAGRTLRGQV